MSSPMVVDTTHYDTLGVPSTATQPEMWTAFQKLVAIHQPSENAQLLTEGLAHQFDCKGTTLDPIKRKRLQDICIAFQVLSNDDWRRFYDRFGRGKWDLENGSVDAADYFAFRFASGPFIDWFGETYSMDVELERIRMSRLIGIKNTEGTSPTENNTIKRYQAEASARRDSALGQGSTDEEKELMARLRRRNSAIRKMPITKEEAFTIDSLERKLLRRIRAWTETEKTLDATGTFLERIRLEVEPLKSEVLGCDMLHRIGVVYINQAEILLHSQRLFGVGVPFVRMRDKRLERHMVKSMLRGAHSAETAYTKINIEEERRLGKGGAELDDEGLYQYHRRILGQMLTSEWLHQQATAQAIVRTVCELVLQDVEVPLPQRLERARALRLMGQVLCEASPGNSYLT